MRADIHDGPEHNTLHQRPDTLMQDRKPTARRKPLATRGRTIHWVNHAILRVRRSLPIYPDERTFSVSVDMSQKCQFRTHAPQRTMPLFNHLVGLDEQQLRHFETERKGIDALASAFAFDAMVSAFRRS
jgi:hypothetical protein